MYKVSDTLGVKSCDVPFIVADNLVSVHCVLILHVHSSFTYFVKSRGKRSYLKPMPNVIGVEHYVGQRRAVLYHIARHRGEQVDGKRSKRACNFVSLRRPKNRDLGAFWR
jgi:hypothetical protein